MPQQQPLLQRLQEEEPIKFPSIQTELIGKLVNDCNTNVRVFAMKYCLNKESAIGLLKSLLLLDNIKNGFEDIL